MRMSLTSHPTMVLAPHLMYRIVAYRGQLVIPDDPFEGPLSDLATPLHT